MAMRMARAAPSGKRLRDVVRVGRHAEAHDLAENFRAASARAFQRLQNQTRAAFAQNQPAPFLRKGPAGIGRNHAHRFPRFQEAETEHGFAAARERSSASPSRTMRNA